MKERFYRVVKQPIHFSCIKEFVGGKPEGSANGFVGKLTDSSIPFGYLGLTHKNGLYTEVRREYCEEVGEFEYETNGDYRKDW